MAKLRVHNLAMSLDGYVAGPDQSLEAPMGVGARGLHEWVFATRFGRAMFGGEGGATGVDNDMLEAGVEGIGATVMGRNMFGPVRGPWPDASWQGWWGDEPPFHTDVFVLTHHARDSFSLSDTTFHFVTEGVEVALERAFAAAGGKDVRLGGGAQVVRECLAKDLVDFLHIAVGPVLLGGGERVLDGPIGLTPLPVVAGSVAHLRYSR